MNLQTDALAMIQAVESNAVEQVKQLLAQGLCPNTQKKAFGIGFEPILSICIRKKFIELADLLLHHGAKPESFSAQLIALQCKQDFEDGLYRDSTTKLIQFTQQYPWPGMDQPTPLLGGRAPREWIDEYLVNCPAPQRPKKP